MDQPGFVIRSRRVVTPGGVRAASIRIIGGIIAAVSDWDDVPGGMSSIDAGDLVVMPGIVDTHVHINEPGRTDWEGFETATRAAAAGGATTIFDMPLNSIPATTTAQALEAKRAAAAGKTHVNVEFIGGVVPGNANELEGLARAGVRAFKCFLSPSGVDEFRHVTRRDLREAFPILARIGLPLMVHAEDPEWLVSAPKSPRYSDYLASRPVAAERSAVELLLPLIERWPVHVHIVHLASASELGFMWRVRNHGLPITVETCPHYLTFAAEEIPDGATQFKCAPPIRDSSEREGLWKALIGGYIDMIASDHSPCPPAMKESGGDFSSGWGGIASLQLSLSAVWTGARSRGVGIERIAQWMSAAPAKLGGVSDRKGAITEGRDADIVVWNPDESFTVDPAKLEHRHKLTPYAGRTLYGKVLATYVGGRTVFTSDRLLSSPIA